MKTICFNSSKTPEPAKPAVAPPAPEPTPEEIIAPEDTTVKQGERRQAKAKGTGVSQYQSDLNVPSTDSSGLNVPV